MPWQSFCVFVFTWGDQMAVRAVEQRCSGAVPTSAVSLSDMLYDTAISLRIERFMSTA